MMQAHHSHHQESPNISLSSMFEAAQFLLSIPAEDANLLQHRREYHNFLRSVECLKQAYQQQITSPDRGPSPPPIDTESNNIENQTQTVRAGSGTTVAGATFEVNAAPPFDEVSFLQRDASSELICSIIDFLECRDLVRAGSTCVRIHALCHRNVEQRCPPRLRRRQLSSMQLLRCAEQMEGVSVQAGVPHVPCPILLPERRILVSNCGVFDYNGIYFCTEINCNGFIFTKPRSPRRRVPEGARAQQGGGATSQPGELLRCVIAKRFSGATILWYMSKEVIATEPDNSESVKHSFSFWAKLMTTTDDGNSENCEYPSQTSWLERADRNGGWKNLETTPAIHPPVVELLD